MPEKDGNLFTSTTGAIRDTTAHNSSSINNPRYGSMLFVTVNTLNQACSVKFQGSPDDGTTWIDLATAVSVSATTGTDKQTLTDKWPLVRAVATCSVSPASGTLAVYWFYNKDAS